jgi:signal transduction histidine kinase
VTSLGEFIKPTLQRVKPSSNFLRLGADYSFSWWVLLLFAFPSYGVNLIYDAQRNNGTVVEWIPVALLTYSVTIIMFVIAKLIKFVWSPRAGIIYAVGSYTLIGWARGLTSYYAALYLHIAGPEEFLYRMISGPIFTIAACSVFAAIVTTVSLQQEELSGLASERTMLRSAIKNFRQLHQRLQDEMLGKVQGILQPAIQNVWVRLDEAAEGKQLTPALASLQTTVDDIVRPLSHEIASEDLNLELDTTGPIQVVRTGLLPRAIPIALLPGWAALLSVVAELAAQALLRSIVDAAMVALFVGFTVFIILKVLESVIGGREYTPVLAFLAFVGSYLIAGVAAPLFWLRTSWHMHQHERFGFAAVIVLIGVALYVVELANAYRRQIILDRQQINDDMAMLTSQLRQQVWLDRKRIAMILHGSVQGALYAAAIRLSRESKPTPEYIAAIEADITKALAELASQRPEHYDFEEVLDEITAIWEDAVDFRIAIEPDALKILNRNSGTSECALEVVREAVNNAIKHSKTEAIAISITKLSKGLISVAVKNDGGSVSENVEKGYGSSVLDELTHQWKLINVDGGVQLQAAIVA